MDENLNQQNWGGANSNIRPVPPPPPPPEITLRTMQSDIDSIKQSGGENPIPKPFTPPEIKKQTNMELEDLSREEGMIKPSSGDGVVPPSERPKNKLKIFILITVLILVIAGGAYAGYKYLYPLFKPAPEVSEEQPIVTPENTPIAEVQLPSPEAGLVPPEEVLPINEAPIPEPEITPVPDPIVLKAHVSLLVPAADLTTPLNLSTPVSLASIKELLTAEAANKSETATALKELILSDQGGQLVFADTLPLFLSVFTSIELAPLFEEDFTSVIFYDANGAWFGMLAKPKEGTDIAATKTLMAKLEASTDLKNLYIQDPGTPAVAGFKAGSAKNLAGRFLSFSTKGASLNYGWTPNNLFVISTSYNGLTNILTKLGIQ